MASQWKSQFDDSEETDDELQGEHLQSPEHHHATGQQLASLGFAMQLHFGQHYGTGSAPTSPVLQQPIGARLPTDLTGAQHTTTDPSTSGQTALCVATLPRRSKRPPERMASNDGASPTKEAADAAQQMIKGSSLDGLDVEGTNTLQVPLNRDGLPRTWSNPQLSSHIRPGLEPPRLQQAAFDDCVYAVDVMRNVAVKQTSPGPPADPSSPIGRPSGGLLTDLLTDVERKLSLPARVLCPTTASVMVQQPEAIKSEGEDEDDEESPSNDVPEQPVAGRLEIRMVDQSGQQRQTEDADGQAKLHATTTPVATAQLYQAAEPTQSTTTNRENGAIPVNVLSSAIPASCSDKPTPGGVAGDKPKDDGQEKKTTAASSLNEQQVTRGLSKSPQRRLGTVIAPVASSGEEDDDEDEDDEEDEESDDEDIPPPRVPPPPPPPAAAAQPDYHVLSERMDDERRKISVINLDDLSAAFQVRKPLAEAKVDVLLPKLVSF